MHGHRRGYARSMARRQNVGGEAGNRPADILFELLARIIREIAGKSVEAPPVEEDSRQSVIGREVLEHRTEILLHFGQYRIEELGGLRSGHDVRNAARQIQIGRPCPLGLLPKNDSGAAQRSLVAPCKGIDRGVNAQVERLSGVDKRLQVVPCGRAFDFGISARQPCAEPLHLIDHRRTEKHVAGSRPHIDYNIGESGLPGLGQIAQYILLAAGEIGKVGGGIDPDEPGFLHPRLRIGIGVGIGPLPFGFLRIRTARNSPVSQRQRRQNRRKPFDILFHLQNYACFRTCIPGQRDAGRRDVTCRHNPTVRHGYSWYFRRSSKDRDNNRQTTGSAEYRSSPFRKQPDI